MNIQSLNINSAIMKKLYLILMGLIILFTGYGQNEHFKSFGKSNFHHHRQKYDNQQTHGSKFLHINFNHTFLKNASEVQQRLDSLVGYVWNGTDSIIDYKEEFIYNDFGLIVEHQRFLWNGLSGNWILDDNEIFEYNEEGNLLMATYYTMDETSSELFESWKGDYFYDENNRLTDIIESQKDSPDDEWNLVWKTTYTYDDNGRPVSTLEYSYILGWQLTWSIENTYDANGNLTKIEEFSNDNEGEWLNEWQEEFTYDDNNRLVEYFEYEWNEIDSRWDNADRETFTYDANNNVDVYTDYDWSDSENDWVLSWKEEYTYNNDYEFDQLTLPWFYLDDLPNFMNHMLTRFTNYNYENNEWVPAAMGNFYFSEDPVVNSPAIDKSHVSFYPNPATTKITFLFDMTDIAHLYIYDVAGNAVQNQTVRNNRPVSIDMLPDGLYLFRLTGKSNELIFSGKVLKK